ncbi:MAG: DUF6178 family protein [Acidobacteriia bacterium]|nr:DUF6178 family protein [Terriglobia bacterium]
MSKAVRRARRSHANALAKPDQRPLLERILDTPNLARVVPRLQPELLHRVIEKCGLEDSWQLVALATPEQLARVIDLDLWRADRPGTDERFDADRFGVWIEVLLESGPDVAAQKLAQMDADLVVAGLAPHALVFDRAARPPGADGISSTIGGYLVVAKHTDAWDAIVTVLRALNAEHRDAFHRVMRGCRSLSNSGFELDGLHDLLSADAQAMFDLAVAREQRREQQGYMTAPQARAFLQMARQLQLTHSTPPTGNPVARAYFRAIESIDAPDAINDSNRLAAAPDTPAAAEDSADEAAAVAAVADVVAVLKDSGVLPPQSRALLGGAQGHEPPLARIQAYMQAADGDPAACAMRSQELAYLANTIVAGCSIQARPFTAQEASDAAAAICSLGLENWPQQWSQGPEAAAAQDLVAVFQVGWTVLHDDVAMYATGRLIEILTHLRYDDGEIQTGLAALRVALAKHARAGTPWRAREALDVIAILDMPAWAALLGLIDECPVIHAGLAASRAGTRAVNASAFEFISQNSQIASVRDFMQSLPETLRG